MRQNKFLWLLLWLTSLGGGARLSAADGSPATFGWPGPDPGRATATVRATNIALGNAVVHANWTIGESGLGTWFAAGFQPDRALRFTGEVFQVVLTNGQRYLASAMKPEGLAKVAALAPTPNSSRRAGRIAGQKVEWPLRTTDGRLRVLWRAILLDGGNYVRQELELQPLTESLAIKEIAWVDQPIAGAQAAGRVDGVPLVADNFFFGCEDPMALNVVQAPLRPVGAWSPDDLSAGQRRRKVWSVEAARLQAGTNRFEFKYERGPHRLDIWRVALVEDGREVAQDAHHGWTGTAPADNSYLLTLPAVKPFARFELAADLSTDPNFRLPAGQQPDSHGQVYLAEPGGNAQCRLARNASLRRGESLTQSFVVGIAPPGQMRRAFLYYLERERAHPYRPYLHYNSWYDTAWTPFALNETNCLEAIRLCGDRFIQPHGVVMDGLVFDDGWDNPKTLWQFHSGFPNGFAPLAKLCEQYHTRLGVWLSPFGGYGEPKNQRLKFGQEQGYEINATGFSLAGPKYYGAFKRACVEMIRNYGVNHFKFDGIATGMYASGGAEYIRDTEAMRRLMLELRQEDPNLYINLTTGSWPSPFWLRFCDSLWRQGGDMGHAGKGTKQQQWLTYRDQEVFRNIVRKSPLYPLNALMTQGVAYSRQGMAGDPTFNAAGFKDDVRAFFGGGTSLQELYIQPGKLTAEDWRVLAEAAKWSRTNADVLVDTHWLGGDPSKAEIYGYASWTPRKGIVMLRNPDDQPHEFALDVRLAFELPPGAPAKYTLKSPWAEDAQQPARTTQAGQPLALTLKPFEVLVWDVKPNP